MTKHDTFFSGAENHSRLRHNVTATFKIHLVHLCQKYIQRKITVYCTFLIFRRNILYLDAYSLYIHKYCSARWGRIWTSFPKSFGVPQPVGTIPAVTDTQPRAEGGTFAGLLGAPGAVPGLSLRDTQGHPEDTPRTPPDTPKTSPDPHRATAGEFEP